MYAQSHAVHWTQEYDQEEGLYTKIKGPSIYDVHKKSRFWLPLLPVHMGRTPPCERPHTVDMKYTPLSWNG